MTRVKEAKKSVANLDAASAQVRQVIADLTGPDEGGVTAAATIRESLSNVNVAAANMADGTEALKHNFLLRGFFRSRGYYSLANISPDLYRKDRLFAAQNTDRAWLPADQLFHRTRVVRRNSPRKEGPLSTRPWRTTCNGFSTVRSSWKAIATATSSMIALRLHAIGRFWSAIIFRAVLTSIPTGWGRWPWRIVRQMASSHTSWNGVVIVLLKVKR